MDTLDAADTVGDDLFERAIEQAIEDLPDWVRGQLDSVAIVVEDWPSRQQLASVDAYGLFGLYQGVPRTAYGASDAPVASKITLFRRPLEAASSSPEELAFRVEQTLYHEIAHHLGISDARLRELAAQRRSPR